MRAFKKKGELTRFQILAEIAENQPHIRQRDIAEKLGITVQAVSENIKTLTDQGYLEAGDGRSYYKLTKKGMEKLKKEAITLRKYADTVLETMSTYKSTWPAIAKENLQKGEEVELFMEKGILYAKKRTDGQAHGKVLHDAKKGEDVALTELRGLINLKSGKVTILVLPRINEGGSRTANLQKIEKIYKKEGHDKVGIMGTVARAVANKLNLKVDFEFATPEATLAAAKRGLNVLVLAVGRMSKTIARKLEEENIEYKIENVIKKEGKRT
ncbi:MAG TPA: winged helix-turn-helix transcriptional regulator [Methanothermobacter sp.]|uniref:Transcriptional regulator n=1 Tax=Methanothermobacter tenebrarum TaxID=680118 RepID=A0ABN6PB36_9EURY|nr:MarR family transcriptional regulator [Methanothermobacter tenebrarum]MDD3454964.1 winged helix-turn-helix transcriptional regulator [Methanobacteriales archaeon]MDI6881578.1 winged helix-turn-helix transcriptional regulator [Methanothermobacter sp.]BDH79451.1 transcriptional regulator [Methanothermobacter tenebrarum]HHW16027.1 winged helix-turn-helix transcriptional regulator [Methanothermobacter sp.]HOQ19461.1 winged helix-turn-helix transcriptional regulator [Methanothermobacter sp.]